MANNGYSPVCCDRVLRTCDHIRLGTSYLAVSLQKTEE